MSLSEPQAVAPATITSPAGLAAPSAAAALPGPGSGAKRWRKSVKQIATLGPSSSSFEMIEKLFLAGADVFRLNFSHGSKEQKAELVDIIREIEAKWDHPIAILADLQVKLPSGNATSPPPPPSPPCIPSHICMHKRTQANTYRPVF